MLICELKTTHGRAPHPMAEFTHFCRLPLERAIEVVEDALDHTDCVLRKDLQQQVSVEAPEATSLLDHTIQVMIHGGYVRRVHMGPDRLAYEKTERWPDRNEMLIFLRAPSYKKRFRPRSRAYLAQVAAQAPTLANAKKLLSSQFAQRDLFGDGR